MEYPHLTYIANYNDNDEPTVYWDFKIVDQNGFICIPFHESIDWNTLVYNIEQGIESWQNHPLLMIQVTKDRVIITCGLTKVFSHKEILPLFREISLLKNW